MVFHTVGDTGDHRGQQQDFVAEMMTQDAQNLPANQKPAFFYHLGDVVYFAGDIDMYGDNFYATYKDYPGFIVAIPGNHDCQPDDPQDGPGRSQQEAARRLGAELHVEKSWPAGFAEDGIEPHPDGLAQRLLDLHHAVGDDHRPVLQRRRNRGRDSTRIRSTGSRKNWRRPIPTWP